MNMSFTLMPIINHYFLLFLLFSLVYCAEFLVLKLKFKRLKFLIYPLMGAIILSNLGLYFTGVKYGFLIIISYFTIYRIINLYRKVIDSSSNNYLSTSIFSSSTRLIIIQLVIYFIGIYFSYSLKSAGMMLTSSQIISSISIIVLIIIVYLNLITHKNVKSTRRPLFNVHYFDRDLPTVSVLIPARNETDDLEECLVSLVKCDYPKLEILVLDDCSQNRKTSDIIRSFAHAGVRFIEGNVPPEDWLAKNYAYQQLSEQASGDILLFCGVDVRFSEHSLRSAIELMLAKKISMISFVPKNIYKNQSYKAWVYQPARYAFELSIPRYFLKRPPVLSTCWLIKSQDLSKYGQFKAIKKRVTPESYFSRLTLLNNNRYNLVKADEVIDISSSKPYYEQYQTAIRTYYPKLHRKIELVSLVGLGEFIIFIGPLVGLMISLGRLDLFLYICNITSVLLLLLYYSQIINLTYNQKWLKGTFMIFIAAIFDISIYNISMIKYEFGTIYWKERNICLPIMQIDRSLPKFDKI